MTNRQQGGSSGSDNDRERAAEPARKSGQPGSESRQQGDAHRGDTRQQNQQDHSRGQQGGAGNFENDRERAAEAGRKGGEHAPDEKRAFSKDPGLASDAGRKGGQR